MSFVTVDGVRHYYRLEGRPDRPVLILSHSLGADHGMWEPQMPVLADRFRVLRYDTRGHGASDAPAGDYTIEMLGRDVLALADALGIERFSFCGVSMGGGIGQWVAVQAHARVERLVLANTAMRFGAPEAWAERMAIARDKGMAGLADMVMERFFSQRYRARDEARLGAVREVLLATDPQGYAGCCAALRDADLTGTARDITAPTLVIAGEDDVATPPEETAVPLAQAIGGARLVRLKAGHISNVELPGPFTGAVMDFLSGAEDAAGDDPYAAGLAVRRAMLGDAHVDRSLAGATPLTEGFQELITRYAWGTIWTRPGLDRRTRRLLVIAQTVALGRWEEFALHVRAGLEHELTLGDLEELLLQSAVYCGVPAANTAFQHAREIAAAREAKGG